MKIRLGFVSNSSSSSFCLMGIFYNDFDEIKDFIKEEYRVSHDDFETSAYQNDLQTFFNSDEQEYYVGIDIDEMGENETRSDFVTRSEDRLLKIFETLPKKVTIHYGGCYNG